MTTTALPPDVNTAFATERAAQLAAAADRRAEIDTRLATGSLVSLGGDRYRITDPGSWDNGETVTLRGGQLLAEHGLDTSLGKVALYSAVPAWHGLGAVIPGGTSDVAEVLRLGGIDYQVSRRPVLYQTTFGGPARVADGHFVTTRDDTDAALGVVGAVYRVLQNHEAFEFLQDLTDTDDIVWESAGALRGGRRVFVSLRLPATVRIDTSGIDDEIVPFVVAVNSHDGSSDFQVVLTPWRPVCGNTERFALRDAHARWGVRHTANARERILEARRTLGLSTAYFASFAAEQESLAHTEIAIGQFRTLIEELWPTPADGAPKRSMTGHARRIETLTGLWNANTDRLGTTAYAAERAITEYLDWNTVIRPKGELRGNHLAARATAVMEGTADDMKTRTHRRLMTLTHR